MAGFATRASFAGRPSRSATTGHALTFNPDHLMGAGHNVRTQSLKIYLEASSTLFGKWQPRTQTLIAELNDVVRGQPVNLKLASYNGTRPDPETKFFWGDDPQKNIPI